MTTRTRRHRESMTPSKPLAGRARAPQSRMPRKTGTIAAAAPQTEHCDGAALFRLMTWLSPSFPVGAFAYSSGIEWAVEAGEVADAATLQNWIEALLRDGSGFCDAVLFVHAFRAIEADDRPGLRDV